MTAARQRRIERVHKTLRSLLVRTPVLNIPAYCTQSDEVPPGYYSQQSLAAPSAHPVASIPDFFDPNIDIDAPWLGLYFSL